MNIDIQSTTYKGELMKTNEHLLIPDNVMEELIDNGSFAKACVLLLDIAVKHNNTTLTNSAIANSINNIDDKTITKYRNEIKKDTNG